MEMNILKGDSGWGNIIGVVFVCGNQFELFL